MGVNLRLVLVVDLCLTPSSCTEPSGKGEKGTCVAVQGRPEGEKKTSLFSAFFYVLIKIFNVHCAIDLLINFGGMCILFRSAIDLLVWLCFDLLLYMVVF